MDWLIYGMVYLGSALMVYNIYSYVLYAKRLQEKEDWGKERSVLYVPIVLLVLFLIGYLVVGIFGKPDLVISGILFGGSIFVSIIFRLLQFITNRVQENEKLEAKLTAAEESNKARSAFMASVSHEMRTPMNAIIGLDLIALKNPSLHPETRRQLEKIGSSANQMMGLIENILDMNDIESGKLVLKNDTFSLHSLLGMINTTMLNKISERGIFYQYSIIGNIDDCYVGDQRKLRQVLLGILDNAVKFTPDSGNITFITEQIESTETRRTLRFIISDTGVGMDKEFQTKLFNIFSREHITSTDQYGGVGLSLAIAKNIVGLMEGSIEVLSDEGIGSTFTVTVKLGASDKRYEKPAEIQPAAAAVPEEDPCEACAESPAIQFDEKNTAPSENPHILVVEDIDLNAEIIMELLGMEDISSDRAENGQIAVEKFSESPEYYYDAILMDIRMPVMDGLEATRNIRAMQRSDAEAIPIIALSANASDEDIQNSLESGMDIHLSKPVDSDKLFETLKKLIGYYRENEQK